MARTTKKQDTRTFINVAVSKETRAGLHLLKESMGVAGQAEVIEKLVVTAWRFILRPARGRPLSGSEQSSLRGLLPT